jgi:hypothetical protein
MNRTDYGAGHLASVCSAAVVGANGIGSTSTSPRQDARDAHAARQFPIVKLGLTCAGAAILCLHKTWVLGRVFLWIILRG